jgi:hypothetical protein
MNEWEIAATVLGFALIPCLAVCSLALPPHGLAAPARGPGGAPAGDDENLEPHPAARTDAHPTAGNPHTAPELKHD